MSLDEFLGLTMRQLVGLLKVIDLSEAKAHYYQIVAYAQASGNQIKVSLEEFLGLTSKEESSTFDKETDEKLERYMQQRVKNG
jgi:hypothetical protein